MIFPVLLCSLTDIGLTPHSAGDSTSQPPARKGPILVDIVLSPASTTHICFFEPLLSATAVRFFCTCLVPEMLECPGFAAVLARFSYDTKQTYAFATRMRAAPIVAHTVGDVSFVRSSYDQATRDA